MGKSNYISLIINVLAIAARAAFAVRRKQGLSKLVNQSAVAALSIAMCADYNKAKNYGNA